MSPIRLTRLEMAANEMPKVVILKLDGQNWSAWLKDIQKVARCQQVANYIAGTPPVPFKEFFVTLTKWVINSTVLKPIARHFQHLNTVREYMEYLTKRFDKPCQLKEIRNQLARHHTGHSCSHGTQEHAMRHQERVKGRVDEKLGEMPHGKVDKEVAAAGGLGKTTTDHQQTDGVSLVTLTRRLDSTLLNHLHHHHH